MNLYEISNPNPDPPVQFAKRSPVCETDPFCANKACDKSLSPDARIAALLQEMTIEEKAENLVNGAAGVPRLGLPPYEWWSEVNRSVNFPKCAYRRLTFSRLYTVLLAVLVSRSTRRTDPILATPQAFHHRFFWVLRSMTHWCIRSPRSSVKRPAPLATTSSLVTISGRRT